MKKSRGGGGSNRHKSLAAANEKRAKELSTYGCDRNHVAKRKTANMESPDRHPIQELKANGIRNSESQDSDQDLGQVHVVQVGGDLYKQLLPRVRKDCFSDAVEHPNIYLAERKPTTASQVKIEGLYEPDLDEILDELKGFTCLKKPYAVFADDTVTDAVLKAAKDAQSADLKMPTPATSSGDTSYHLLFASVDVCEEHLLTKESASILGHGNEAVTKLGEPVTSQAEGIKNLKSEFGETKMEKMPLLQNGSKRHFEETKSPCPTTGGVFTTLLAYARNATAHQEGLELDAYSTDRVLNKQQTGTASVVAIRELQKVIMVAMYPAVRLMYEQVRLNNEDITATVLFNAAPTNAKTVTAGGWGCAPHRDGQDAGGAAFIIQYGLGDLSRIRGGFMCFPQFRMYCPVGACTVHFIRTASVVHNTLPHVPTDSGRVVGTSLHLNKSVLAASDEALFGGGGPGYVVFVTEEEIEAATKEEHVVIDKLLTHTNWSGKLA